MFPPTCTFVYTTQKLQFSSEYAMPPSTSLQRLSAPFIAVVLVACARGATPPRADAPAQMQNADSSVVKLSGAFHIVWGDTPSYVLVDAGGRPTTLVVSPDILDRHNGARSLDRKRVTLTGTRIPDGAAALRVLSIALDPE